MPVPAGPDAERDGLRADRVDVGLLRHGLRRDLLAAVPPDDVLEHLAHVVVRLERAEHGVDGLRADLVAALDQLDELVDHLARLPDLARRRRRASAGSRAAGSCSRGGRAARRARSSPIPASSAATALETSRTSCTQAQCRRAPTRRSPPSELVHPIDETVEPFRAATSRTAANASRASSIRPAASQDLGDERAGCPAAW